MDSATTTRVVALVAVTAALSFTAGFYIAKKKLSEKFDEDTAVIAEEMKQHYIQQVERNRENARTEIMHEINETIIERQGYFGEPEEADDAQDFEEDEEEIVEVPIDRDTPYIISSEEFFTDNPEHEKITITYYEGDDTLTDDQDEVIPDEESLVGPEALTSFGKESGDTNIVYIRNERLATDFEVVSDSRTYTAVVLGMSEPKQGPLRMREVD